MVPTLNVYQKKTYHIWSFWYIKSSLNPDLKWHGCYLCLTSVVKLGLLVEPP